MSASLEEKTPQAQSTSRASQWLSWAAAKTRRAGADVTNTNEFESASSTKSTTICPDSEGREVDTSTSTQECADRKVEPPLASRYAQFITWASSKQRSEDISAGSDKRERLSTSVSSAGADESDVMYPTTNKSDASVETNLASSMAHFVSWVGSKRKRSASEALKPESARDDQGVVLRRLNVDNEVMDAKESGYTGKWVRRRVSREQASAAGSNASIADTSTSSPSDSATSRSGVHAYITGLFARKNSAQALENDSYKDVEECTAASRCGDSGTEKSDATTYSGASSGVLAQTGADIHDSTNSNSSESSELRIEDITDFESGEQRVERFVHTTLSSLPNIDQQTTMQQHATQLTSDEAKQTWDGLFQKAGRPLIAAVMILFEIVVTYKGTQIVNKADVLRFAVAVVALVYVASPVDLVPDVIPVAGLADDFVVASNALFLIMSVIPRFFGGSAEASG